MMANICTLLASIHADPKRKAPAFTADDFMWAKKKDPPKMQTTEHLRMIGEAFAAKGWGRVYKQTGGDN